MSQTKCSYHPDHIAVDTCERCRRPICLTGKRVYRKRHSSGTGSTRRTYYSRHIYCPPCNADVATNDATGPVAILGSIVFIVFAIFIGAAFASVGGIFAIVPFIIVGLGIYQFIQRTKKADDAKQDEKKFLNSLNHLPDGINQTGNYSRLKGYSRPDKPWKVSDVTCFNCGLSIILEDNFCVNCGDSTKEERQEISR